MIIINENPIFKICDESIFNTVPKIDLQIIIRTKFHDEARKKKLEEDGIARESRTQVRVEQRRGEGEREGSVSRANIIYEYAKPPGSNVHHTETIISAARWYHTHGGSARRMAGPCSPWLQQPP